MRPKYHWIAVNSDRLRQLVAARNRELLFEALVGGLMGVVYVVLTCGLLFWIAWFTAGWRFGFSNAVWIGAGVAALFLVVSTIEAIRRVNPFAPLKADWNDETFSAEGLSMMTGAPIVDRRSIAGAAAALLAGPAGILEAIADFRRRLPMDERTIDSAWRMLQRSVKDLPVCDVDDGKAFDLLHRLALVKVRQINETTVLMATMRGLDLLRDVKAS